MQNLNHLSVSSDWTLVTLIVILNLYIQNLWVFGFSIIYLILTHKFWNILIFEILICLIILSLNLKLIKLPYYCVASIKGQQIIATNLIYDIQFKSEDTYTIGDCIKIDTGALKLASYANLNAKNIYYLLNDSAIQKLTYLPMIKRLIAFKIEPIDDLKIKAFANKLLLQVNDYEQLSPEVLGVSFSYYLLLNYLELIIDKCFKKRAYASLLMGFTCFQLFGFNMTIWRLLGFKMAKRMSNEYDYNFSFPVLFMIILNPKIIYHIGFKISVLIHLLAIFKNDIDFKTIILMIESYFFNEVSLIKWVFYHTYLRFYSFIYLSSLLLALINPKLMDILYQVVIKVEDLNCIQIKGHLSIAVILFGIFMIKNYKMPKFMQKCCMVLLIVSNISNIFGTVTFIDVGQGDAILIKAPFNRESILIDTGPKVSYYLLKRSLNRLGVYQIDHLIITHSDEDHIGNLLNLVQDYEVLDIVYEDKDIATSLSKMISLNHQGFDNSNDNSLVYYLNYLGRMEFLFTGDISSKIEAQIIKEYPLNNLDVLKLSHHGSKTGSCQKFLYYLNPYFAIASTNGRYGHPHPEVIENLKRQKIRMLSTSECGDISFIFTNLLRFIACSNGEFVIIK